MKSVNIEIVHLSKHFTVVEFDNGIVPIRLNVGDDRFTKSETVYWNCQLQGCLPIWIIRGPVDGFHHIIVVPTAALNIEVNRNVLTQRLKKNINQSSY